MATLDKIIDLINKENYFSRDLTEEEKKLFFNIYLLTADTKSVDEQFLYLQDEYLKQIYNDYRVPFDDKNKIRKHDNILDIETDLLVIFSEDLLVNGEHLIQTSELSKSIDNRLIVRGGLQIRSRLYDLLENDGFLLSYTKPYLVKGNILPAKNVAKLMFDIRCDFTERVKKLSKNIENLAGLMKNMNIKNCVIALNTLPNDIKNNKKIIKHIKNVLKIAQIKTFFVEI